MLPIIATPKYNTTMPSTGEKIIFRPFLVKEEKALLLAQQSEDLDVIIETLNSIIESCTDKAVNPNNLAIFDIEWLILQFRARSIGEVVDLTFRCDECKSEKSDTVVSIDLLDININKSPDHNKNVVLFNDIGVIMKYPSMAIFKELEAAGDNIDTIDVDKLFDVVVECIEAVFDADTVYAAKDTPKEELRTFLENLTKEQFEKIQGFFKTMPKISKDIKYTCPVCGINHEKVIEGFQSFFQ